VARMTETRNACQNFGGGTSL